MKQNMGRTDKLIRIVIAILILLAYNMGYLSNAAATVLGIVATIFALTSFMNFCPLYSIFGINTCDVKEK